MFHACQSADCKPELATVVETEFWIQITFQCGTQVFSNRRMAS